MLNMPGRFSTVKDKPNQSGVPLSLLGAMDGTIGNASQGYLVTDPVIGSPANLHTMASIAEGACCQEKYNLLVRIFTARDRQALQPYAWAEDLLKDFFKSTLGINLSVTLLSLTKCLIYFGIHTQVQGMSWEESLWYDHQLTGTHPWTSYTIDMVALQHTLKEAHHDMQVVREFTHERTKQRITHLKVIASSPVWRSHPTMLNMSPRGCSMTWQADCLFIQEQLQDLQITKPAFPYHPALLDNRPETPDPEQHDFT